MYHCTNQILSGLVMVHVSATRILPLIILNDPSIIDLTIVTSSFQRSWIFPAYYTILMTTGMYHTLYGASLAFSLFGLKQTRFTATTWRSVFYLCFGVSVLTTMALAGVWEDVQISHPIEYDQIHNFVQFFRSKMKYIFSSYSELWY